MEHSDFVWRVGKGPSYVSKKHNSSERHRRTVFLELSLAIGAAPLVKVQMSKLSKPLSFETIFGTYVVDELLGEGGAGRVYGGRSFDQAPIAVKVLAPDRASTDRRNRFKNEIAF